MRIAAYLRLSEEDDNLSASGKAESESISNQRALVRSFIRSQPSLAEAEIVEFCDDGWSGRSFERPGFKQLLEQVQQGAVQCIVVKDLSRFGRDYLVVGNYLSRVFPFLGVRFIAVNDGFDSARPQDIDSLDTSFKTLLYDLYSRELSQKTRNALRQKAEKGFHLSGLPLYGYRKDPDDKRLLLVDEEAARIVRQIFQMAAGGTSTTEIAAVLNQAEVPTPRQYKCMSGVSDSPWPQAHGHSVWTDASVRRILREEQYTGRCIYGRQEQAVIGGHHTVRTPRFSWVITENAHEAIVSQAMFDAVQPSGRTKRPATGSLPDPEAARQHTAAGNLQKVVLFFSPCLTAGEGGPTQRW